ncbi:MAG: zinc-binding alcohol dehydrogenase family protein [Alicyclobacillus sp.]|nr:zinc-binding alcohol dehydrogenase family protein [Alicyclobacillus sp.]
MSRMRAVVLTAAGELVDAELPQPQAAGRDLLVRVRAVAVNPVDTKQRAQGDGRVLGYDVAGDVVATGPECQWFRPGDAVYYAGDITRPGGLSEYHLVDERIVGRKPRGLSFVEAAALPLTALTAWEGLFDRMHLPENEGRSVPVLIVGAAGGVGSMAVQLARWAGLTVIGTASRAESAAWVKTLGAHAVVDHRQPLRPQLQALGYPTVPYIFCLNAIDEHWDGLVEVLAPQGTLCSILPPLATHDWRRLFEKSATWCFELMFTRSRFQTPDMARQHDILERVADLVEAGTVRTTLRETLAPLSAEAVATAFARLRGGHTVGKIGLTWDA